MHCVLILEVPYLEISPGIKLSSYPNGRLFRYLRFLIPFLGQFSSMGSMNEEGAMEIVHATLQASDVNSVPNIEPADIVHSNHVLGFPSSSNDSASDSNVLRPWLLAYRRN